MSTPTTGLSIQVHQREEFLAKLTSVDQLVFLCGALAISLHVDVLRAAMDKLKQNIPSQKSFYSALAGYLAGVVSEEAWTDAVERCVTLFKIKLDNDPRPYPHEICCGGCRMKDVCNGCGKPLQQQTAVCTNGRCPICCRDMRCKHGAA